MPSPVPELEHRLASEQQSLTTPLRGLVRRDPVTCLPGSSAREAGAIMHQHGIGSVIVSGPGGQPEGIFSERDLVRAVACGSDARAVSELMSRGLIALPAHAPAYEAALLMMDNGIRHVLVNDEAGLLGVVSERDLFSLQRLGLGELTAEIRLATTIPSLSRIADEIRRLTRLLVKQGVAAEQLTLYVSVLNDRLCQRLIRVIRDGHQLEKISWCWLGFGSEGRLEQTFSTDQDNGIIFAAHYGAPPDEVRGRLLAFARDVNTALDDCGYRLCRGNVMASNPALCLSVEEWRNRMAGWLSHWEPRALLEASIYFDFRPLYGDVTLATELRSWVSGRARAQPAFLRQMAAHALSTGPALGALRDFITEDATGAPHSIDLKLHGIRLFVDAARIYSLAQGLPVTNTIERLRAAGPGTRFNATSIDAFVEGFLAIQQLRLRHQAAQTELREDTANRIDPDQLNEFQRKILLESLRQARKLQQGLALDYQV